MHAHYLCALLTQIYDMQTKISNCSEMEGAILLLPTAQHDKLSASLDTKKYSQNILNTRLYNHFYRWSD